MTISDRITTRRSHGRKRDRPTAMALCVAAAAAVLVLGSGQHAYASSSTAPETAAESPPACAPLSGPTSPSPSPSPPSPSPSPPPPPPPPKPTTITTLQQVYQCIFAHYFSGSKLDDRTLLTSAFARFTAELQRRGVDQPQATLPRLTGDRTRDWSAFAGMYRDVLAGLPADAGLRQALASETILGMIDGLHDNHNAWVHGQPPPRSPLKLGILPAFEGRPTRDIRDSTGPLYLSAVVPGSPAANAGLKAGDILEAVDGVPVFINGQLTPGVLDLLQPQSEQDTVQIRIHRLATDTTWTVELHAAIFPNPPPPTATVKLLDGDIAQVEYPAFDRASADQVLKEVAELRAHTPLRGIILDVRGNGGGAPEAVAGLLGAFVHGKVWSWDCDVNDHCTPNHTDDSVALLKLPLVVLTDGRCASACDAFSAGVKDLGLGKLVGARTAGIVSGLPTDYTLDDDSQLLLTSTHQIAANREIIDGIGVAVSSQAPMTAEDLSNGRDPAVAKALSLLAA